MCHQLLIFYSNSQGRSLAFCRACSVTNGNVGGANAQPRFSMHILPQRFVKIRHYGILGSRYKKAVQPLKDNSKPDLTKPVETKQQRMVRLTGFDPCQCPRCKTGTMQAVEVLLRSTVA